MAFNQQIYSQARPDLQANWQAAQSPTADPNDPNVQFIRQFPSIDAYMQNDFQNNPQAEQQQAAQAQKMGPVGATQAAIGNIRGTPVESGGAGGGGLGFTDLVNNNTPDVVTAPTPTKPALPAATATQVVDADGNVTGTTGGNNYRQDQAGGQTGAFSTSGSTSNKSGGVTINELASLATSLQNQSQKTGQNSAGSQTTSGVQTSQGQQTGQQVSAGQTSSKVDDSLGFGGLIKGQAGQVQASDAARSGFLQDTMLTGGTGFNSQVDQAVRQSLSGPGRTGTGESAAARAAGYASADVARNNMGQRLQAAQQLSGPTGLATLSGAATPYLGSTQTTVNATGTQNATTGQTQNSQNTNNASQSTGFSDLVGSTTNTMEQAGKQAQSGWQDTQDKTSGTAAGASTQSAAGQIPQSNTVQQSSGGGCIVCTAGIHHGLWRNKRVLRRVVTHKLQKDWHGFRSAALGYFLLFTPFARACLSNRRLTRIAMPVARAVVYEELRVSGRSVPFKLIPWLVHWTWHGVCSVAGDVLRVPEGVQDQKVREVAQKHSVWFNIGGL